MATSEAAPLNPTHVEDADPELEPYSDDARDSSDEFETPYRKTGRDPLYILIFYGLSFVVSVGGLGAAIWGYRIARTAPFDKESKKFELQSYQDFLGMRSICIFLSVNIMWSGMNFLLALKGLHIYSALLFLLNPIYDFCLWGLLIAFGVMNMVHMLPDRRLCDGLPRGKNGFPDRDLYRKCDAAMYRLLVVQMIAVNMGILVAVLHFILMIGRCCTCRPVQRSLNLQWRIAHEEHVLSILTDRRKRLVEENEELLAGREARSKPLPHVPVGGDDVDEEGVNDEPQEAEEHLIDLAANEENRVVSPGIGQSS